MICPKCKAENEEWSEYCFQCHKRLKPLKFSKATLFGIVLCMLESGVIFLQSFNALLRNITRYSMESKIKFFCMLGFMLFLFIRMIILLVAKKKRGIMISGLSWIVFLGVNIIMGSSPIFSMILFLPVFGIGVSLIPVWKNLEM